LVCAALALGAGWCAVDVAAPHHDPTMLLVCPVPLDPVAHANLLWSVEPGGSAGRPLAGISASSRRSWVSRAAQRSRSDGSVRGGRRPGRGPRADPPLMPEGGGRQLAEWQGGERNARRRRSLQALGRAAMSCPYSGPGGWDGGDTSTIANPWNSLSTASPSASWQVSSTTATARLRAEHLPALSFVHSGLHFDADIA
jgi:hypothetical protein